MSLRVNVNMYPNKGYFFVEKDGTKISGRSWGSVIARVRRYRARGNFPAGDPENEVHAQACERNPNICIQGNQQVTRDKQKEASLKTRVLQWFGRTRQQRREFVPQETANQRSEICKGCPHNIALPDGCASCRAALKELRKEVLGEGRAVDGKLIHRGCVILGFEQATAAHIDEPTIENAELPGHCWKKRMI